LSSAVEMIEAEIEEVEAELASLMPLIQRRHQLLTARAAILRDPPPALFVSNRRVTRAEVAEALESQPGLRAGELAAALGAGQPAISAHLYRGEGHVFLCRGGRWYLRREPT